MGAGLGTGGVGPRPGGAGPLGGGAELGEPGRWLTSLTPVSSKKFLCHHDLECGKIKENKIWRPGQVQFGCFLPLLRRHRFWTLHSWAHFFF